MSWPHTHVWWLSIEKDISAVEVHLVDQGAPAPHRGLPARASSAGKRIPNKIWLWKSAGILAIQVRQKGAENPNTPLKGLCTDSLISRHLSWPLVEGLKLRTYQNIQEKIESGEGWSDSHHCPFVESSFYAAYGRAPSFLCWAYSCHSYIWICISLVRSPHSTLVTSWHLTPPNLHIVGGASMAGHPAPPQALSRRFLQQASALTQPESLLVAGN